jgi:hypothetical protein
VDGGPGGGGPGADASTFPPGTLPDGGIITSTDPPPHGTAPAGAPCKAHADCQSGGCNYAGKCAATASCTGHNGGDTCGPNGASDCCETIAVPLPSASAKLDKYLVTAGRMRAFIERTGGDVRGFIQAHRPAWFEPAWDAWVPNVMDDGTVMTGDNHLYDTGKGQDGVYQQLGPIHYGAAEVGGNEGCLTKEVGNARTFRLPDDVNTKLFGDVQQYPQDVLDKKPQQCATFFMFAAFCAWDGGRMPTNDEFNYAWDTGQASSHKYPWGNTPTPGGWDNAYPFDPTGQGFGKAKPSGSDIKRANANYNFFDPPQIACINNQSTACDYSLYIAPPGHYPTGDGPLGHSDLAGDMLEFLMPMSGTAGGDPLTRTVVLSPSGAFDIPHAIPNGRPATPKQFKSTNKYLAVGARCARDG